MESMVNWIELYYCGFQASFCENGKSVIMLPVAVIAIVIAMYNLGSTADSYLSPALEAVSDKFMCSESLAGVTLLALGNGAPDVFAAIAAGGDEDGLNLQVSSLIGSSFFIVCVVMGLVLNSAPQKTI
jgi:sodium/potassium/calcium exchanger 6